MAFLLDKELARKVSSYPQAGPWTKNSLRYQMGKMREHSRRARTDYRKSESMMSACEFLARAYDKAAEIFEKALMEMEGIGERDLEETRHNG
jgi:hypothetical protein